MGTNCLVINNSTAIISNSEATDPSSTDQETSLKNINKAEPTEDAPPLQLQDICAIDNIGEEGCQEMINKENM